MIKNRKIIITLIFTSILLAVFISEQSADASNRLIDFKTVTTKESSLFIFKLEDRPKFSFERMNKNTIFLLLRDTAKSEKLEFAAADKDIISIKDVDSLTELHVFINNEKPFSKINSSWLSNDKILLLEVSYRKDNSDQQDLPMKIPVLNDLRFGILENGTRMIIGLTQQPSWEFVFTETTAINMKINAASTTLQEKYYGPIKALKKIIVSKNKDQMIDLDLQPESQLNEISIFWLDHGNRLVVDFFNTPDKIYDEELLAFDKKTTLITKSSEKDDSGKKAASADSELSIFPKQLNSVRMKIVDNKKKPSEPDSKPVPSQISEKKLNLNIDPEIDSNIPEVPIEIEQIQNLSSEEAYLFGRIQQALEINDFNKGIELANQFIAEFPSSPLIEKILFWRGDFYYSLWKSGEINIAEKTLANYQSAVDNFRNSEYLPLTYIKMAQISSSMENHFPAIGYLSVVISKKRSGEFLPLAYLTRGKIYLKTNQSDKAIDDFKKILMEYPTSNLAVEARFWVATYYHAMGMYEEAEKRFTEIDESNHELYLDYPEYLFLNAKNNLYLEKYSTARDFLFKGLNIGRQPETIDMLLSRIGDTYHNEKNEKEAEKYYRIVVDYYPKSEGASIAKLRLSNYLSDITMLDDLGSESTGDPLSELAMLEKGYQLFDRKQYADVMDSLFELTQKPVETQTRQDAKLLYFKAAEKEIEGLHAGEKYQDLVDMYSPIELKLNNNIDPETALLVANAYREIELHSDAIKTFLKIKPYDLNQTSKGKYIYGLADAYLKTGDRNQAKNLLEKSLNENLSIRENQKTTKLLAGIYWEMEKLDEAYTLYKSILQDNSKPDLKDLSEIYISMGKILRTNNSLEESEDYLNKAITTTQNHKELQYIMQTAYIELGLLHYTNENLAAAIKSFEKGFSLGYSQDQNGYWENKFRLASAYLKNRDHKNAIPLFNEISDEGDTLMQQKAQIKIGEISLKEQLNRLSINES